MPTLSRREKWFGETRPIKEGDLVFVVDEGTRNRWQRGRVVRTHPGKDGQVRRVDVRTVNGVLPNRAVVRLALLDVAVDGDAEETLQATRGENVKSNRCSRYPSSTREPTVKYISSICHI